ncbi:Aspartate aminotransferase [Dissulfuribacter thermophilus]|uniref:Aminotransferase n=1 Tax=Dissulfuribacter thermophilus TaxID=1156395 RepID=A0A1B9F368_9BACT|nr:pyridoxal phosphate-dependent aminotransferase [Dissulfuribacter thermophilus]OCC14376.1 Aspartate aminotransferase [Dissulfuribacter thermophilus]
MSSNLELSQRVKALKPSPTLATDAKAKTLKAQGVDIVNLSAGEPDFDTPTHIREAAKEAIDSGFTRYTPVGGIPELKAAICMRLEQDYGLKYNETEVMVSTGGKQVLYNLAQAILDPGDEVIIPAPYWVSYPPIVELAGGVPVILPTEPSDNFAINIDKLADLITSKTKAIILNSPSNPTGAIYDQETVKKIALLSVEKGIYIITDDIYDRIRFDGKEPYNCASLVPEARQNCLIVNGVSKAYAMTGWRIGYLAGPENVVKACTKIQSQSTSNPTSVAQKAAVAALTGPQDCVFEMQKAFKERCHAFVESLRNIPGISCPMPDGAFYCFPDMSAFYGKKTPEGNIIKGSLDLGDYLLEHARVACIPGIAFGDDRCIRFSFATDLQTLNKGLERIKNALEKLS